MQTATDKDSVPLDTLRDEAQCGSRRADRRIGRQRVFAVNLKAALHKSCIQIDSNMIGALSVAYAHGRDQVDLRTSFGVGAFRAYVVVQCGVARRPSKRASAKLNCGPLAERVLGGLDAETFDALTDADLSALSTAIEKTEISRQHPVHVARDRTCGAFRVRFNLIAGRDRRRTDTRVSSDRRVTTNEKVGLVALFGTVGLIALLGVYLIASTILSLAEFASDAEGRDTLKSLIIKAFTTRPW